MITSRLGALLSTATTADNARGLGPRQLAGVAAAASAVALVRGREKLGLPRAISSACCFAAPLALAAGCRRSRARDMAVWGAQMWAYKNAFEMPNDDEQRLRRRAHLDYPIVADTRLGRGIPPGQRLQRRLRHRGQLTGWTSRSASSTGRGRSSRTWR